MYFSYFLQDADVMFAKFDVDGDKKVDKAELLQILRGFGCDPTLTEVNTFFSQLDVDSKYFFTYRPT